HPPRLPQQCSLLVPDDPEVLEVHEGLLRPGRGQASSPDPSTQDAQQLNPQQLGGRDLLLCEQLTDRPTAGLIQQQGGGGRGIEHDHAPALSSLARESSQTGSPSSGAERAAIRSSTSVREGTAAIRSSWPRRYSLRETPSASARRLRISAVSGRTSRTWRVRMHRPNACMHRACKGSRVAGLAGQAAGPAAGSTHSSLPEGSWNTRHGSSPQSGCSSRPPRASIPAATSSASSPGSRRTSRWIGFLASARLGAGSGTSSSSGPRSEG